MRDAQAASYRKRADENPHALKTLIDSLYNDQWIFYAKPPFAGPKAVFKYLGSYTHRVAISNNRIVSFTNDSVTFSWKDYAGGNKRKNIKTFREIPRGAPPPPEEIVLEIAA
jgi:hypothetical protein